MGTLPGAPDLSPEVIGKPVRAVAGTMPVDGQAYAARAFAHLDCSGGKADGANPGSASDEIVASDQSGRLKYHLSVVCLEVSRFGWRRASQ